MIYRTKDTDTIWKGYSAVGVGGIILLLLLSCRLAFAQAVLENPQPNSFQSGISVISGWACDAITVVIAIDDDENFDEDADGFADADVELLFPVYGTSRGDTMGVCGDTDNGFGVLYNWNRLGDGVYTVWAGYVGLDSDGNSTTTLSAPVTVTVTTLGHEFLRGVEREASFTGFPSAGDGITLQWQQSLQNFVIRGTNGASGGNAGAPPRILENPQPGAFVSGIGAISGWVCDASKIEIEFDNDAANRWQAGYGTSRVDTVGVCGDANNGFGLLYNWNKLGDGIHTVRAFADGVEFASATVAVTTFGEEFLRDASGTFTLSDFPQPGINVDLLWQQSQQNFAISGVSGDGSEGVRAGLAALKAGNVREANNAFRRAAIDNSADTTAGLYHAVTRIATKAIDTPQLRELTRRSGISLSGNAGDVCLLDFSLPPDFPHSAPRTEEVLDALRDVLVPEIDAALTTLNRLPTSLQVSFVLGDLPSCLSGIADDFVVEIDRSDVQVLDLVRQSLQGTVVLPTDIGLNDPERLNLSVLFSGRLRTLRPFIQAPDTGCTVAGVSTTLSGTLSSNDQESFFRGSTLLNRLPDPAFGGIAPDLTQQDINNYMGYTAHFSDCYTFSGNSGQQISILLESEDFDTFIFLVGPDGLLVNANDDCLDGGRNSCLPFDHLARRFPLFAKHWHLHC